MHLCSLSLKDASQTYFGEEAHSHLELALKWVSYWGIPSSGLLHMPSHVEKQRSTEGIFNHALPSMYWLETVSLTNCLSAFRETGHGEKSPTPGNFICLLFLGAQWADT